MLTKEKILEIFKEADVLKEGHFLLTSGRHSDKYLQCACLFRNTKYAEPLCAELAENFKNENIDVVIGPAMGAIQMAYEVSRHLDCQNFFAEREDGVMKLRRGFDVNGMRVLVVEDVVTTGGSVKEVIEAVKRDGGTVCGVGLIVDRTGGKCDFGVPVKSIIAMEVESWEADECPLCKEGGEPPVKLGSRKTK